MGKRKKSLLITSGLFLFLFIIVALLASGMQGFLIDENIAYWMEQYTAPLFTEAMHFISLIGSSEMILLITVVLGLIFLWKRHWRHFFFFFTLSVGAVILNFLLKMMIQRERPGEEASYIEVFNISFDMQSYSFPSGHAMRATILFLFLIYLAVRYINSLALKVVACVILTGLLVAVAVSRIYLDAHFATDVIGAIIISLSWFFICLYFFYIPKTNKYRFYLR
ncbi:phosphatase PAP2 family protein [Virgibacillus sp. W0181]|uniref:phosphatase PAP2 family protein n=1 Tax=Virgibacillus sp. W0181 TaxID=3391581 RepID=UPI003F45FA26